MPSYMLEVSLNKNLDRVLSVCVRRDDFYVTF